MLVLFETAAGYAIFKVSIFIMLRKKIDVKVNASVCTVS